jgi:hypothetical protein
MPHKNINHLNTIMYKLVCKNPEITDCYAGKTTDFTRRKSLHKHVCNTPTHKGYEINVYQFIRANGGWDNWDMIQIEKYEAVDMLDSRARERYWIETLQAKLNKVIPTRTIQEYNNDNQYKILEYYQANKNKFQEYYQANKDTILEKLQDYYQANKEQINARRRELRLKKKQNN